MEEERIDLLKRMRDGQAWETFKAKFQMACKETVDRRKEEEEERLKSRRQQTLRKRKQLRTPHGGSRGTSILIRIPTLSSTLRLTRKL